MDLDAEAAVSLRTHAGSKYPPRTYPPRLFDRLSTPWNANDQSHQEDSSGSSSHVPSTRGRASPYLNLPPLKLDICKYSPSYGSGAAPPLTADDERRLASRIKELTLSQESPHLRRLGKTLGTYFCIDTPRYEPERCKGHPYSHHHVGEKWRDIQGSSRWEGLLDPIDPVLRAEIIRYGEFCQACYDAVDGDSPNFTHADLLEKVGLENRGYEITDFLYATSDVLVLPPTSGESKDSTWIGFVAVSTSADEIKRLGRRDIVIAWRGNAKLYDWIEKLEDFISPAGSSSRNPSEKEKVMVESRFLSLYRSSSSRSGHNGPSAEQPLLQALRNLVGKYSGDNQHLSITLTGHGVGSALAMLCAYDIALSEVIDETSRIPSYNEEQGTRGLSRCRLDNQKRGAPTSGLLRPSDSKPRADGSSNVVSNRLPITVLSFGGPKVGNLHFCNKMEKLGLAVLRVVNENDLVCEIPGSSISKAKNLRQLWYSGVSRFPGLSRFHFLARDKPEYHHAGVELRIDFCTSPYTRENESPVENHNLEGYLHSLDGYQGRDRPFKQTQRDLALANKTGDLLKPECFIPPSWCQQEIKKLFRDANGNWVDPNKDAELFPDFDGNPTDNAPDREFHRFFRSVSIAILGSAHGGDVSSEWEEGGSSGLL